MSHQDSHLAISNELHTLEKARRDAVRAAMAEYDKGHHEAKRALRERCEKLGHVWRFTGTGPTGLPWFHCGACSASHAGELP